MAQAANTKEIDNSLFIKTFLGVVLLLLSVTGIVVGMQRREGVQLSMLLAAVPGMLSVTLLFRAIKKDKNRLSYRH